jgi:hypothetical protein
MFSNPSPKQSTSHYRPFAHFHKVKSYAGIIGNEYADALARKSITIDSDVADTSITTAVPEETPFYNIYWFAKGI